MGNVYRIKTGLYVLVVVLVGVLFAVRIYNTIQKTNYATQTILDKDGVKITLSYPVKILSPKSDINYPITISFLNPNSGDPSKPQNYEIVFESPSLLFVDSKGVDSAPSLQFSREAGYVEKAVYVRPFLAKPYANKHVISATIMGDGQQLNAQIGSVAIKTEPNWFSYLSLIAASLLEISIAAALVTWIANALDSASTSRKDLIAKRRTEVQGLRDLPILNRAKKLKELQDKIRGDNIDDDLVDDLARVRNSFSEREFFQAVGESLLIRNGAGGLADQETFYRSLFPGREGSISALVKISGELLPSQDLVSLISEIIKLWDDFDVDVKDLIIVALNTISKNSLSELQTKKLLNEVFFDEKRRRLLRSDELRKIFPQLGTPSINYDASWLDVRDFSENLNIGKWLKQHNLISNPFGGAIALNPYYLPGIARPDDWETFAGALSPRAAVCSAVEDARPLAQLFLKESLATWQVFPIYISPDQDDITQTPLIICAHASARTWLGLLARSPDAFLDLPLSSQQMLLELFFWSVGSRDAILYILEQNGFKDDSTCKVLKRKFVEFKGDLFRISSLQDQVLLTWLGIKPPNVKNTTLILCLHETPLPTVYTWCKRFDALVPTLFQKNIITKVFTSAPMPLSLSLSEQQLKWSDQQLEKSLDGQFNIAMDKDAIDEMGIYVRFSNLFGPGVTDDETTKKLVSASRNSLARMLMFGNHLLLKHCENEAPEKYLSLEELNDILG